MRGLASLFHEASLRFNACPQIVHEVFLAFCEVVENENAIAVFIESGFCPIRRSCDEHPVVDEDKFMVQELNALAHVDFDPRPLDFFNGVFARSQS